MRRMLCTLGTEQIYAYKNICYEISEPRRRWKDNTGCPKKNSGVLVVHKYSLLNHRAGTFRKFSAKSVQVLVTWILEGWQHRTTASWDCMKAGVIQSWRRRRKRRSACCSTRNQSLWWLFRETLGGRIEKMLQLLSLFVSGINSSKKPAVL
jgi:hypothetical protein